jgi:hypothetical protein
MEDAVKIPTNYGNAKHVLREISQGIVVSVGHGSFKNQIGTLVWVTPYVFIT